MPTPSPTSAPKVGAAVETSMAPASSAIAADAVADADQGEGDRHEGGDERAEDDDEDDEGGEDPDPFGTRCLLAVEEGCLSAELGGSAAGASRLQCRRHGCGSRTPELGRGTSSVISA